MPAFRDFLPPILTRAFAGAGAGGSGSGGSGSQRKDVGVYGALSGEAALGMAGFLNPEAPNYQTARSYEKMAVGGYGANAYLYRAVTIITQSIAGIPWQLYVRKRAGRTEVEEHPVLTLLNIEANDEDSGPEFIEAVCAYWLLAGQTFVWAVRPETGGVRAPTKLFAIQPNLLTPDVDRDGSLTQWVYQVGGHKQYFAPEDVLRIKDFHPLSRALGMAPAQVAARPLDQHNAANDWNTALLQNMGRPSGLLAPKGDVIIPPDAHDALKNDLLERYQGPRNAGRPLVPRAPMVWQQMGTTPTEMDWLAGKTQAAKEIAIAFGVPPELLGDAANKTYSNQQEARKALYMETILPRLDRLKAALSRFLLPMYGLDPQQYELDYDTTHIEALREDEDAKHQRARADYAGGILTLNRALEAIGEEPTPEGDIYLTPPRAMTLDQLLEGAGLPAMPDGSLQAHAPATLPPGAPKPPTVPTPPGVPQLPAGQIVDANPTNGNGNGSKAVMPPFPLPLPPRR